MCLICGARVYEDCKRFYSIYTGSIAVGIQGKVIGCNGTGIGFSVLNICHPIGIVIAIAGQRAFAV